MCVVGARECVSVRESGLCVCGCVSLCACVDACERVCESDG